MGRAGSGEQAAASQGFGSTWGLAAERGILPPAMPKASWNGAVLADTPTFEEVEGNVYFPPAAVDRARLSPSPTTTVCSWKGTARYYHVVVDGKTLEDAAWYYPDPKPAALNIKDHLAFWKGVTVTR